MDVFKSLTQKVLCKPGLQCDSVYMDDRGSVGSSVLPILKSQSAEKCMHVSIYVSLPILLR